MKLVKEWDETTQNRLNAWEELNLNENSKVLLFGCEGDADEELYQKLLNS